MPDISFKLGDRVRCVTRLETRTHGGRGAVRIVPLNCPGEVIDFDGVEGLEILFDLSFGNKSKLLRASVRPSEIVKF